MGLDPTEIPSPGQAVTPQPPPPLSKGLGSSSLACSFFFLCLRLCSCSCSAHPLRFLCSWQWLRLWSLLCVVVISINMRPG